MRLNKRLSKQKRVKMLLISCLISVLGFSVYVLAGRFALISSQHPNEIATDQAEAMKDTSKTGGRALPDKHTGVFTAYTSRPKETDKEPHITADQTNLKKHPNCIVGNNKLELGTKIQIEGIGICEIRDRIGKIRGANHFDIYMGNDVAGAKHFGKRKLQYSIIEVPPKGG